MALRAQQARSLVLDGARRDWRVAHRTRQRWFSGVLNPNSIRPTCLTIRLWPWLRALDRPVWMARIIGCCQVEIVRPPGRSPQPSTAVWRRGRCHGARTRGTRWHQLAGTAARTARAVHHSRHPPVAGRHRAAQRVRRGRRGAHPRRMPEIARAMLQSEAAVGQRITRAKNKIRGATIPLRVPPAELLSERTVHVLACIYSVFTEGYWSTAGPSAIRDWRDRGPWHRSALTCCGLRGSARRPPTVSEGAGSQRVRTRESLPHAAAGRMRTTLKHLSGTEEDRHQERRRNQQPHGQRRPQPGEVGVAIAAHRPHDGVGLIADRGQE